MHHKFLQTSLNLFLAHTKEMTSKTDLTRIGTEGYARIDEYLGKKGRPAIPQGPKWEVGAVPQGPRIDCVYKYQPMKTHLYQVDASVSAAEEKINSYDQTVQLRDGISIMDYSKRKSTAMAY